MSNPVSECLYSAPAVSFQTEPSPFEKNLQIWCEEKNGTIEYDDRKAVAQRLTECYINKKTTLDLRNFSSLTSLPDCIGDCQFLEELTLDDCPQFKFLPKNIGNCKALKTLSLFECPLSSLPENLGDCQALEHLCLDGCSLLTSIPKSIGHCKALKTLSLNECTRLSSLPESIGDCKALEAIYLNDCAELPYLPERIGECQALIGVSVGSCSQLCSFPNGILSLLPACIIDMENTGMSERVLDRLRDTVNTPGYIGPSFNFSTPEEHAMEVKALAEEVEALYQILQQTSPQFPNLTAADSHNNIAIWVHRLSETATYKRAGETQKIFVTEIVNSLKFAEENSIFRNIFIRQLDDANKTCGDRIALSILYIDLQYRLEIMNLDQPKEIADFLIRGPLAMELLQTYARNLVPTFKFVDEIEVYLGLPVMLKERLRLPIILSEMLYAKCSNLKAVHLNQAEEFVQKQIDSPQTCHQFLIEQPKWLAVLEHINPTKFNEIKMQREIALNTASDEASFGINQAYETQLINWTQEVSGYTQRT